MHSISYYLILTLIILVSVPLFGQNQSQDSIRHHSVDSLYREDQIYIGVTYNLLLDMPSGARARGVSGGLQAGFVRDMPINKRRNISVAVGGGLAYDYFGQNLFIGENPDGTSIFKVLDSDMDYDRNRLGMAIIEAPIEFRWRTSTPTEYRFWRVYTGIRVGYAFYHKTSFKADGNTQTRSAIPEFQPLRLSANLSFGYNTFNFFASYSINPFFKDAYTDEGEKVEFRTLKVGLMFYIL
ncbi:MAG: porin family protein [Aequorivita sp.]